MRHHSSAALEKLLLAAILALALALRLPCLTWGLPPATPEVAASDLRCSYALDEDDVLSGAARMQPAKLQIDPGFYRWGALHFLLVSPALGLAEAAGAFDRPWRDAYYNLRPGDFDRVYAAGRLVSVVMGLFGIVATFLLGRELAGAATGLWAALLVAVSPAHLLGSTQIRVDLTMVALVTLAAWLGLRAQRAPTPRLWLLLGLASGLALAAKYIAALLVLPVLVAALKSSRFPAPSIGRVLAGAGAGLLLGHPQWLWLHNEIFGQIQEALRASSATPEAFRIPAPSLLAMNGFNAARFLIGPIAAVLAAVGIWRMPGPILGALGGGVVSLVLLRWPLLRYQLPVLPFLAVAAAAAMARFPAIWRALAGAAMIIFPLAASIAQVHYMRSRHPANEMLPVILRSVPPGTAIARLIAEMPPLDRKLYPMGPNPLLDDLRPVLPLWVLLTDLPQQDYRVSNLELLRERFEVVAEYRLDRIFGWATLGESGAPHDWKYTHPSLTLYRRRSLL